MVDPEAGTDCQVTLDNGEKILHDQGGFEGGQVTITTIRWSDLAAADTPLNPDLDKDACSLAGTSTTIASPRRENGSPGPTPRRRESGVTRALLRGAPAMSRASATWPRGVIRRSGLSQTAVGGPTASQRAAQRRVVVRPDGLGHGRR